jgi:hypothetical protein
MATATVTAALHGLSTFKLRADVDAAAAAVIDAVVFEAIQQSARNFSGNADITACVSEVVNEICTLIDKACATGQHDRAVGLLCLIDVALRAPIEVYVGRARSASAALSEADANALSEAVQAELRGMFAARIVPIVVRLRGASSVMPSANAVAVESIIKAWKRDKTVPSEAMEKLKKPRAADEGIQPQRPQPLPAQDASAVIDLTAPPPLSKQTVIDRTKLVTDIMDVLSALPESLSARYWAAMPSESAVMDLTMENTASASETESRLQDIRAEASAELRRARDSLTIDRQSASKKTQRADVNAGGRTDSVVVLPQRLQCDSRKVDVVPARGPITTSQRAPKEWPYSLALRSMPPGYVARRGWMGLTPGQWVDEKNLAKLTLIEFIPANAPDAVCPYYF